MLKQFGKLRSLVLKIADQQEISDGEHESGYAEQKPFLSIDKLSIHLCAVSIVSCSRVVREVLHSWAHVKHLLIDSKFIFVDEFFKMHELPADLRLEEFRIKDSLLARREAPAREDFDLAIKPTMTLSFSTWISPINLQNMKSLQLDCHVQLQQGDFAAIVASTPLLQNFRGLGEDCPYFGIAGLSLKDLPAISGWRRLRSCKLAVDVDEEAICAPINTCGGKLCLACLSWSSQRKFVQLHDSDFVPRLANEWRAKLNMLEDLDVVCRVIHAGKYVTRFEIESFLLGF